MSYDAARRPEPSVHDVPHLLDAACIAELAWVGPDGPQAQAVTPLRLGDRPAVALPYAFADRLRSAGSAPWVTLALTDCRMTSSSWRAVVMSGRPLLHEDLEGASFTEHLLAQEARKNPPARAYVDTLLVRRENWWYLPRVVLTLDVADVVGSVARTMPGDDAVLVTASPSGRPVVEVVTVADWSADPMPLRWPGRDGPHDGTATAALLAHDFSVPDLERWVQRVTTGRLHGDVLHPDGGPPGALRVPPPLRLWERVRRHRDLERACRQGIAAAERFRPGGQPSPG